MNLLGSRPFSRALQVTIAFTSLFSVAVIAQTPAPKVVSPAQQQAAKSGAIADPLEIKLERAKIGLADGKESRSPAATAKPGDILEEVATYTNKSAAALKGLEATLPVPVNTELVMDSIRPANAKAGNGTPAARSAINVATVSPPPAESPPMMIRCGQRSASRRTPVAARDCGAY